MTYYKKGAMSMDFLDLDFDNINSPCCMKYIDIEYWIDNSNKVKCNIRRFHIKLRSMNKNWDNFYAYVNKNFCSTNFFVLTETFLKHNNNKNNIVFI
jgi:hypothetical protein